MRLSLIALLVLFFAVPVFAADIDGKWSGNVSTPGGDFPVNYTFKMDGAKLTGTTTGFDGAEVPLKDLKLEGEKISFTVTFDFGGMPFTIEYKGVVTGEQIKLTSDVAGQTTEFVVKKEPAKKEPAK